MTKTICGTPIKNYHYYDISTGEAVVGVSAAACRDNRCLHQHCINSRVGKPYERFHNAFGLEDSYYTDFQKHPTISIEVLKREASKLFNSYMLFDCFTFYRLVVSQPVNKYLDLSWFTHVKKFNKFMWSTLEHCKIAPAEFEGDAGGRRIFYHNIHRTVIEKKYVTVNGHYAIPKQGRITDHVKKVKHVPLELVRLKIEEHGIVKEMAYPEIAANPYYLTFAKDIHCFAL